MVLLILCCITDSIPPSFTYFIFIFYSLAAAAAGQVEVARWLLEHGGARVTERLADTEGQGSLIPKHIIRLREGIFCQMTPLLLAAQCGSLELVKVRAVDGGEEKKEKRKKIIEEKKMMMNE